MDDEYTDEGRGECFESRRKWDNKNPFVSLKRMITTKLPVGQLGVLKPLVVGSGSMCHVTTTASQLPTRDNLESLRLSHNTTMNENVLNRYNEQRVG